jgi:uncharacterized protein (TIGR04255 family)
MPLRPAVPFPIEPVEEVYLPDAPLVAVVAQVRFPGIVSISRDEFIGPFQEQIRTDYPVMHQVKEAAFVLGPQGMSAVGDGGTVCRFRAKDDRWGVSLSPTFVALETSAYIDRPDFVRRLQRVLRAVAQTIRPATFERFGLRYADRITFEGNDVLDAARLVRPELSSLATVELGDGARLVHSFTDTQYEIHGATLHARWGLVPANTQLDPFHGEAVPYPSWLLDLDMYSTDTAEFDVDTLVRTADDFAERIYAFFRWAVEDELLKRCGGAL